ncbi:MAG: ribonuclease J [Planctomycetes bacterium]|nr:ribonuclease J [Planctomycetota bacterium]
MPRSTHLEVIPLGGLGEFGMNFMVYRIGDDCVVVDAGMMFPGAEHLGVDVVIPDMSFLEECGTIHGVVLTHGHEDHIGAVPYLLARHDVPVFASPFTRELIRNRLAEHASVSADCLRDLPDDRPLQLGPFAVETLPVAHSIPQARMVVLRTPFGNVVHTADFKLDPDPVDGVGLDLERVAALGREGVLLLLSDSTNADVPGFTAGEKTIAAGLDQAIAGHDGRVLVTTFSSNINRMRQLVDLARRHGRRMALVGTSIQQQAEVAGRLGLLDFPSGMRTSPQTLMDGAPDRALFLVTGTQGEPMSALARISVDKHREVRVGPGDLVLHSARRIPGNEKSIGRMIDHLLRRGARVVTAANARIHVSGHPARDELRLILQLLRPRYFIPIHGEFRQLSAHAGLAHECGMSDDAVVLIESGDVVAVNEQEIVRAGRVHVGQVFIDATLDEVDWAILRDRRRVAGDGIVVAVVAVDRENGSMNEFPEVVSRGFVPDADGAENGVMSDARDVVLRTLEDATPEERADETMLKARIQTDLKRFLRRRTQRRPLIIPVIVEL